MENITENIKNPLVTKENDLVENVALHAMVELSQQYNKKTQHYSKTIQSYNIEIEKIKILIEDAIQSKKEDEDNFLSQIGEVKYHAKLVAKSNDTFHQDIHSLEELESEYKESMDASEYMKISRKKRQSLKKLLSYIEEQEEELLNQELTRINILEKLTPKRKEIETLQRKLKTLELEKQHFEYSQIPFMYIPTLNNKKEDLIDIDTMEE